jgi:hypothetical protein
MDVYYFDNPDGLETCVTVNVNTGACGTSVHAFATTGMYPPDMGFSCDGTGTDGEPFTYLGDLGSSLSQPFSFTIPAGVTRWSLVFESNFGPTTCDFSFEITGFDCQ